MDQVNKQTPDPELADFAVWWRNRQLKTFPKDYALERLDGWGDAYRPAAWEAWQARAALSSRPVQEEIGPDSDNYAGDEAPLPEEVPYPPSLDNVTIYNPYGPMSMDPTDGQPVQAYWDREGLRDYGARCIAWAAALSSAPAQGGECEPSPTEAVQDFPRTVENLTLECDSLRTERDWYKQRARMQAEHQRGEVWYWQNDGEDHLESLVSSLPVVILAGHLRELLAMCSAPAREQWQPIETAPKDGRKLLLTYKNSAGLPRIVVGGWVTDEEAAETDEDGVGLEAGWYERIDNWGDYYQVSINEGEPTHWMPLPAAPGATAEPAPAREPMTDEADMFWDGDDGDRFGHDIEEIVADYGPGEVVKIDRAKRLPSITVRVVGDEGDYEVIEEPAKAAAPSHGICKE